MKAAEHDPESDDYKVVMGRAAKILEITFTLGTTKDKDNIMKEAKELFYNQEFVDKLDQDKYLMCFRNGVVDFRNKVFRKGYPEDYISKCTEIDYIPLSLEIHQPIMNEIRNYMSQLFPEAELCEYVWNHLASCLIGDTALNQCLHYYTGIGQNGKSMLVKFMQSIMGSYSGELDVGFYTQERAKRGQSTPELFAIIGVRFAITSEPSEGDKMNEGPMKQLTSGTDPMSCRAPYGQLIKFVPQANAIIMANHFLEIRSRDHGTWRRVRVIEFKSLFTDSPVQGDKEKPFQFKKVDNLDIKFEEWKLVFMAMLVERAFKTGGVVKVCDMVSASSNKYRQNQDFLSEFISEKVVKTAGGSIGKSELSEEFNAWYRENYGSRVNKIKELQNCMDKQFGAYKNGGWQGVSIVYNRNLQSMSQSVMSGGTDQEEEVEDDEDASQNKENNYDIDLKNL
jgi:P4 family phage/plasmid primase-like protien